MTVGVVWAGLGLSGCAAGLKDLVRPPKITPNGISWTPTVEPSNVVANVLNRLLPEDFSGVTFRSGGHVTIDPIKVVGNSKAWGSLKKPDDIVATNPLPALATDRARNYSQMQTAPTNDLVVYQYRLALWEMRQGDYAAAKTLMTAALETVDSRFGKDKNTERASKLFHAEKEKTFVGEPYERAMASLYYGFLLLREARNSEAWSSFKTAEWEDSWALTGKDGGVVTNLENQADFVLPYYLRGLFAVGDESQAMYVSATNAARIYTPPPPPYASAPTNNVVLLVDFGTGPQKYVAGKDKRELHFTDGTSKYRSIRVSVATNEVTAGICDDVTFQAITRGGRVMDYILDRKSKVKEGTQLVGWAAIAAGATAAAAGVDPWVATGVLVGGMLVKSVSEYIKPQADARCWDNLPQFVTCATLALPPGQHVAKVEFLDANSAVGLTKTVKLDVAENQLCAAYVSEFSAQ